MSAVAYTGDIKSFLDEKAHLYNQPRFIETDPIQIPHQYSLREDIEIAAFLTATIAWGNRKSIIKSAQNMMRLMGNSPYDFVMSHSQDNIEPLRTFVHRTFNGDDFIYFIKSLQHLYNHYNGLETVIAAASTKESTQPGLSRFKQAFFELPHPNRTRKHISDPAQGSSAKRLNMFLRWMVRNDNAGVDFGIWRRLSPARLSCPLDVHSGAIARKIGLLQRSQNDARAVAELNAALRKLDPADPVKYDFALFGLGAFEAF
jgi:uncharacterized protein (TIGR02757 family)